MASGLRRLYKLLTMFSAGEGKRLDGLSRQGRVILLSQLDSQTSPQIIEIDLGLGREFWALSTNDFVLSDDGMVIPDGKLIVEDGSKLKSAKLLRERGFKVEKVSVRF